MRTFLLLSCFTFLMQLQAQNSSPKNPTIRNLSFDLGGPGVFTSVIYDQRFKGHNGPGFNAGIGVLPISVNSRGQLQLVYPVQLNWLVGQKRNYFEFGAGITFASSPFSSSFFSAKDPGNRATTAYLGYRYQSANIHGFMFRALVNVFHVDGFTVPWPGLSFGWRL
jgi:hypothetical protein